MAEHTTAVADTKVTPAAEAVKADLNSAAEMQTEAAESTWLPLQFKLSLGAVDDPQEAEADAMADKVMRMPESPVSFSAGPVAVQRKCAACEAAEKDENIQRKCADCEQEEAGEVQRKTEGGLVIRRCAACEAGDKEEKAQRKCAACEQEEAGEVQRKTEGGLVIRRCAACDAADKKASLPPASLASTIRRSSNGEGGSQVSSAVSDSIAATRGGGTAMASHTREFMESRFGTDFSGVRIHDGSYAASLSRELNAQAFTIGNDIYFNSGKYNPDTSSGKRLLAHELTHTLQQSGGGKNVDRKVIRRVAEYATPQDVGTSRTIELPAERRDNVTITPRITRQLSQCECRQGSTSERTGWFTNPDLNNFVIAFSYCRRDLRSDTYVQFESQANDWLNGRGEPEGTASLGSDLTFRGGGLTHRISLLGRLSNEGSGTGPGSISSGFLGRGLGLDLNFGLPRIMGLPTRLQLGGDYMFWNLPPGIRNPHEWSVRGGISLGRWTIGVRTGRVGDQGQDFMVTLDYGRDTTPEVPRCERRTCICPPPHRIYTCDNLQQEDDTPAPEPTPLPDQDIQHYFEWNSTQEPTGEPDLISANQANLAEVVRQVAAGSTIVSIRGYASPEGGERAINETLALNRGVAWRNLIRAQVPAGTSLPVDIGRGELLGAAPAPEPGSHLVDVIRSHGFQSAAELTGHLIGAEFSNRDLSNEFLGLFREVTDRSQRLTLFGLTEASPLANRVIESVDQFVANNGRGRRPWERIFQMFRMATVKLRPPLPARGPSTPHAAVTVPITGAECDRRQQLAESRHLFGPPTRVHRSDSDALAECERFSLGGAPVQGCNYSTARGAQEVRQPEEPIPAPDIAPVPIGPQPQQQTPPQGPPATPPLQRPPN